MQADTADMLRRSRAVTDTLLRTRAGHPEGSEVADIVATIHLHAAAAYLVAAYGPRRAFDAVTLLADQILAQEQGWPSP